MKRLVILFFMFWGPSICFAQIKPLKAAADAYKGRYTLNTTDTATLYEFAEDSEAPLTLIGYRRYNVKALYNGKTIYLDSKYLFPTKPTNTWLDAAYYREVNADHNKNIKLYGKKNADAAKAGNVIIGMPYPLAMEAKGKPENIRTITTAAGKTIICNYPAYVLTFLNGKLIKIEQ